MGYTFPVWVYPMIAWVFTWKAIACWKAARRGQMYWFVGIFFFNTLGILPILYLIFFKGELDASKSQKKTSSKNKASKN